MLNDRDLHDFWVVTKEGGFARAAERLDMAVQTISAQVRELEGSLGHQPLKPAGRGVALTEAGQAAPRNPNLRLSSERLADAPVEWSGRPGLSARPSATAFRKA
jgi:hypothetical protein